MKLPVLHSSLPDEVFYCYVRMRYFYQGKLPQNHDPVLKAAVYGVRSRCGKALGFNVLLENGASWAGPGVPISALCHTGPDHELDPAKVKEMPLRNLQAWDCFGENFSVEVFRGLPAMVWVRLPRSKEIARGSYLWTIDWWGNGYSDTPWQHKQGHFIALDNGNFCLVPNNYCCFHDPSFTDPFILKKDAIPQFKENKFDYSVEDSWVVEGAGQFFYQDRD